MEISYQKTHNQADLTKFNKVNLAAVEEEGL